MYAKLKDCFSKDCNAKLRVVDKHSTLLINSSYHSTIRVLSYGHYHVGLIMSHSGRLDQGNTGLTEPDWSGNFYRTEPDLTKPDLIAYKFSNIPSFKVSETLNYEN